jgi:uncharacterized protein YrrD
MLIELGAAVYGVGGAHLGEVDGLVVNAGTKRATYILVAAGLGRGKHQVGVSAIKSAGSDGVRLETTGRAEAQTPTYAEEEVAFQQRVEPPEVFIPAAGVGGPVVADGGAVPGEYPDSKSFFDLAPIDPPPVEIESSLGENQVILGKGSDAFSADGHKLGDVVALELGDMGTVEGVTVSEGFIFKERKDFPLAEIDEFGTNAVHLRLNHAEADAR